MFITIFNLKIKIMGTSELSLIVLVAFLILLIAAGWKINVKAGQPGWACIVPIYGTIISLRIIGKPGWWFFLLLVPVVNFIIFIIMAIELAKVFGKGTGFGIGLLFLPFIFSPILAFGKSEYIGVAAK